MIEHTLEELISYKMSLAYEFNPDSLEPGGLDFEDAIKKTKRYFLDNKTFVKTYEENIKGFDLENDIDDLMPLAITYAYYFALDYIFRKNTMGHLLNTAYIKECISSDKLKVYLTTDENKPPSEKMVAHEISSKLSEFYDYMRKQKIHFSNAVYKIHDPRHVNPVFKQEEKDYFGQIPNYFRKVLNVTYLDNGEIDYDKIMAVDLLPAIFLGSISVSDLLPSSSKTKSGTLNFSRLEKIDKVIKNRMEIAKEIEGSKWTDLLYKLAFEDLFYMNRLNNTIIKYLDFNIDFKKGDYAEDQEAKLLKGVFAHLFLPSFGQQKKYSGVINEAATMLLKGNANSKEIFNKILPAFFSSNILYPQLLVVLSNYLFSDKSNGIISEDLMKNRIDLIEEYINSNQEKLISDIIDNKPRLWEAIDEDRYIRIIKENKGLRKGAKYDNKRESRYRYVREINHEFTELNIDDISMYLIDPNFRWKYATIIERNMGLREFFEEINIDWHKKCEFHRYKHDNTAEADIIVSTEFFILLSLLQFEYVMEKGIQVYAHPIKTEQCTVMLPMF